MVLDGEVLIAVTSGDVDAVKAWLAADPSRDVNDFCQDGTAVAAPWGSAGRFN